jgi:hypothetical protein
MQRAVDLDERHRPLVHSQNRERGVADVLSVHGVRVARDRRDRRRALDPRMPEAVDDVLGFDARPHDDAYLCQARPHLGELIGKGALRRVEFGRTLQQAVALDVVARPFFGATRQWAVPLRESSFGDHGASSRAGGPAGKRVRRG